VARDDPLNVRPRLRPARIREPILPLTASRIVVQRGKQKRGSVSDVEFLTRLRARRDEEQRMRVLVRRRLLRLAESAIERGTDPSRRVCFLSYDEADSDEVAAFIEDFGRLRSEGAGDLRYR
jgi:hypothetical protein